jgi:hypothetical protein
LAAERARLALVVACLVGCAQNGTGVMLTVDGPGLRVDDLEMVARFNGLTITQHVHPAAALSLPVDVLAELPDAPTTITFDVTGRLAGVVVGHGVSDPIVVTANRIVPGRVSLLSTGGDLGAADLTGSDAMLELDLATADGAPPDLSSPDLTPPPDLSSTDLATLPIIFLGDGVDRVQNQSTVLIHVSPFAGVLMPGDLLLLVIYAEGATPPTPSGWTYVTSGTPTGSAFSIFYKRAVGATEMDTNVTLSATATIANSVVLGYRNVSAATPLDAYLNPPSTNMGSTSANTISFTAPSITTTRPNDRVVAIYVYQSGAGETWMTPPNNLFTVVTMEELGIYDGPFAIPGATGPETVTATFVPGTDNAIGGAWLGALAAE